jgi:hypothetical protein
MRAAGYNSNPEVTAVLIEGGADVNAMDKTGKRAADYLADDNDKMTPADKKRAAKLLK